MTFKTFLLLAYKQDRHYVKSKNYMNALAIFLGIHRNDNINVHVNGRYQMNELKHDIISSTNLKY